MDKFKKGLGNYGGMVSHFYVVESTTEIDTFDEGDMLLPLYWSNEDGWVPFFGCDRFTHEEAMESNLPLDSKWMSCMTAYQFTSVDGAYVTTEITSLLDDPNLEIGNLQEIDPT